MALPPKVYQFLVSMFASIGSILYGYDLGVIAGAVASDSFESKFNPTEPEKGAVVAVFTGGAFFGAMFAGPSGDYLGRKKTILLGSIIFIIGGALQAGAENLGYMYAGRAIAGLGVGFLVMIIPLYQAELAHPSIRGAVTALQQFMLGIGSLVAAWTTFGTNKNMAPTDENQWRVPLGIQIVPAGILALLIMLFPESPRWLISHGKNELGLSTLAKLHSHGDITNAWVRAEYDQINDAISFEKEHEAKSYLELFKGRSSLRRLILVCAIQASVQMTGVSAIQYYSPDIYGQIGIDKNNTLKYQGISSVLALCAQAVCIATIDKVGRRWAMIGGNLANCLFFVIATIMLAVFPPGATNNASASWGFIVVTWLYNISFSATNGPLSWIVPAEVFDTRTRSKGVSIGVMVSFAFNTMIGQVTPIAMGRIGWRFYVLFCVCNFTNALYFWATQPETKKRPLEEMNYLFTNAPIFVPTMNSKDFATMDLEVRAEEVERKGSMVKHDEEVF